MEGDSNPAAERSVQESPGRRGRWLPRTLRGGALLLIVLAFLDPDIPSSRNADRVVAVVALDGSASTQDARRRVEARLEEEVTVASHPDPGADATVLVGAYLPAELVEEALPLSNPVFLVRPQPPGGAPSTPPRILQLQLPHRADPGSRIPIHATVELAAPADELRVTVLTGDRVLADTLVDGGAGATAREGTRGGRRVPLTVEVVPPGPGPLPLRIQVDDPRTGAAQVDALVQVEPAAWRVHVHDTRPSWKSTFVRRALEEDPRLRLTSRTATSPGTATTFGLPPLQLTELTGPGALEELDLVVVGAPEGLTDADAEALEGWVRERGGSLLLLGDAAFSGPVSRLTGVREWVRDGGADPLDLRDPGDRSRAVGENGVAPPRFRARSILHPGALPPGARLHAATASGIPAVWSQPLGEGTVLVSGALDSWHFRDPEASEFEIAWRELAAWAASRTPPRLEVEWRMGSESGGSRVGLAGGVSAGAVAAGALVRFQLTLRGAGEDGAPVHARARLGDRLLPLAPGLHPGSFQGWLQAPSAPGPYEVRVEAGLDGEPEGSFLEAGLPLVVLPDAAPPPPDPDDLLESWVAARGGALYHEDDLRALAAEIRDAVTAEGRGEPWHPMRSPWWLLPLALALAGEWWWRRRRGLA